MQIESLDALRETVAGVLGMPASAIDDETSTDTVSSWDSLKHLNLVLALEDRFSVSLTEEQSLEIVSLPLIRAVLAEHGIEFSG